MSVQESLSKNRYEHIHVRFSPAIHGLRNLWKGFPALPPEQPKYRQLLI
jgi:hypothetical protein